MKGRYVIHGQKPPSRLQCHVLRHPLAAEDAAYLGWDGSWYPGAAKAHAFVFPSYDLARRYAQTLMEDGLFDWMPVAVDFPSWLPADAHACRECGCIEIFACPGGCAWHAHDLCSECAKPSPMSSWAVYEGPRDHPRGAIARKFVGVVPTEEVRHAATVEDLRSTPPGGLVRLDRTALDEPALLET